MMSQQTQRLRSRAGYTIVELLVAIGIFGVLAAAGLPHLDTRRQDINSAAKQVIADYRWARTRAITSGVHYTVNWTGSGGYQVQSLKQNADTTWSLDQVVKTVTLPTTVLRSGSPNTIEFNTRGMVVAGTTMSTQTLTSYGGSRAIAIWPSGQANAYQ
jgi:prepilin-type N-terminal cleavage/methylation domain-containing protein